MTNNKLPDNDIVKALECCADLPQHNCKIECPYFEKGCDEPLIKDTLDLINRLQARVEKCEKVEFFADKTIATLQAENERAYKEIDRLSQVVLYNDGVTEMKVEEAKTEAYKECIEKCKEEWGDGEFVCAEDFDDLLKELVGDNNES